MGTDVGKEYNAARTRSEHDSDCSIHNEPAYPAGACDCRLAARKDSGIYAAFDAAYADYKKEPTDYEKNRAAYIEYLLMCVRLGDWHGVSDAANDLRVLEAREKPGG